MVHAMININFEVPNLKILEFEYSIDPAIGKDKMLF